MCLPEFKIVNEAPMMTDTIEAKVFPSFYQVDNSRVGKSIPILDVSSQLGSDPKIILLRAVMTVTGKTDNNAEDFFTIKYGVRFGISTEPALTVEQIGDEKFLLFIRNRVYQRLADRVNHIGLDLGLVLNLPLFAMKKGKLIS